MSLTPLLSCSLSFLILTSTFAQVLPTAQESKAEKEKAQKELESKALKLLDTTLAEAQTLKLVENRSLFQSVGADLLWTRDEKRARTLFQDAVNSLAAVLNSDEIGASRDNTYATLTRLRFQTIRIIARRDPQLALDLLHASRPQAAAGSGSSVGMRDQELMMEQTIAAKAAENDPKRAFKIAEESLKNGVSLSLLELLYRLKLKDSELATRLASDIIQKIKIENLTINQQAALTATELLRTVLRPSQNDLGPPVGSEANPMRKPLALDDQTVRDLAEALVNAGLSARNGSTSLLIELQSLLPDLEKRLPERVLELRQRIDEVNQTADPQTRIWMQYGPLMRDGAAETILAAAAEAPPQMSTNLYSRAARKLMQVGDMERAREVITHNLSGLERDLMLAELSDRAIAKAISQGKMEDARKTISALSSKEARAGALAQLAVGITQCDRKLALEVLDEARKLINSQPDNQKEVDALLQVAGAYALVEPARTFELTDPLIDQANEILSAAALLGKFGSGQRLFRQGEMVLQVGFLATDGRHFSHVREVASLARADFERTKTTVDRFQRSEIRLLGRLLIAQSILSDSIENCISPLEEYLE